MHLHVTCTGDSAVGFQREFKVEQPDDREQVARAIASYVRALLGEVPFRNSGSRYVVTINAEWVADVKPAVTPRVPAAPPQRPKKRRK